METFRVRLEARDPGRGVSRSYRIEAGADLFGMWLVDATFGCIGSRGRTAGSFAIDVAARGGSVGAVQLQRAGVEVPVLPR